MISKVVKTILIKYFLLSGYFKNIITSTSKSVDGFKKDISFFWINLKFAFDRFYKFHKSNCIINNLICQIEKEIS